MSSGEWLEKALGSKNTQVILFSTDTEIGKPELAKLTEQESISRLYLLKYHPSQGNTTVEEGYCW